MKTLIDQFDEHDGPVYVEFIFMVLNHYLLVAVMIIKSTFGINKYGNAYLQY
jgi:hypothetical protein